MSLDHWVLHFLKLFLELQVKLHDQVLSLVLELLQAFDLLLGLGLCANALDVWPDSLHHHMTIWPDQVSDDYQDHEPAALDLNFCVGIEVCEAQVEHRHNVICQLVQ